MRLFFCRRIPLQSMSKAKGGSRGRIPPRGRSSARKAAQARGVEIQQGDLGEVAFVHKAIESRFHNCEALRPKPSLRLHRGGWKKPWRVQVKTCTSVRDDLYKVGIHRSLNGVPTAYTESELDFVVVYIMPKKTWYVLPVREVVGRSCLRFRDPKGGHRRDPYGLLPRSMAPPARARRPYLRMKVYGRNDYLKDCLRENSPATSAVCSPPERGTYLQASRGSKKALHLVMRSRRSSCESLDTQRI